MESIKIACHVSTATAIRSGSPLAGESLVPLSTEVLSALTDAERARLAEILGSNGRLAHPRGQAATVLDLPSGDASPEAVLTALRAYLATYEIERAAWLEEQFAKAAARPIDYGTSLSSAAEAVLALAPEHPVATQIRDALAEAKRGERAEWLKDAAARDAWLSKTLPRPSWAVADDAEVTAAIEAFETRRAAAIFAAKAQDEAREAAKEAAKAAAESRKAAVLEALRAYALTVDELRPAAEDGYDVSRGVVDHLAAQVADLVSRKSPVRETRVLTRGSEEWEETDEDDRKSPRAAAVLAQRELAKEAAALTLPDGVSVKVCPVQLVTRTRTDEYGQETTSKRTALFALLSVEGHTIDRAIYGYCE